MFWMKNKENNFPISTLIWRPVLFYLFFSELQEGLATNAEELVNAQFGEEQTIQELPADKEFRSLYFVI